MKILNVMKILVFMITVVSHGYSMIFAPTVEQTALEQKTATAVKIITDNLLHRAHDVEKVAQDIGPVEDINKAVEAAHLTVQGLVEVLSEVDRAGILHVWTCEFYNPIRENMGDKATKAAFVLGCFKELESSIATFHMVRLFERLRAFGATVYHIGDVEDSEDGEGDVEGDDEDVLPNGAV